MAILRSLDDQTLIQIDEGENLLVGRLPKCDVVINHASVSSQHARLHLQDNVLRVVDIGSTNGTRINYANLVKPGVLQDGDTLELGSVSFMVVGPELRAETLGDPNVSLSDFQPLDASQPLAATMSIDLADEEHEEENGETDEEMDVGLEPVGEEPTEVIPPEETVSQMDPLLLSMWVSLGILAVAGVLLFMYFRSLTPQGL